MHIFFGGDSTPVHAGGRKRKASGPLLVAVNMKHQFREFPKLMVLLLVRVFRERDRRKYLRAIHAYERYASHLFRFHGPRIACKILKQAFATSKRVAFGYRDGFEPYVVWQATDHLGLPRRLYRVSAFLESTHAHRVFALSVFALFLMFRVEPVFNLSSIREPFQGKGITKAFKRYTWGVFRPYVLQLRDQARLRLRYPKDLVLLRGGPWKIPSVLGSVADAQVLLEQYLAYLPEARAIVDLVDHISGLPGEFYVRLSSLALKDDPPKRVMRFASLSVSPDRGGKTRMFVAMSYWIQYALYPIHDLFMSLLRLIPEDFTYRQQDVGSWIIRMQRSGRKVYSYDLTDATDRFSRRAQRFVLGAILGTKIARWWDTIMHLPVLVSRRNCPDHLAEFVRYESGQPMGSYSSWPVFALTHHCVVRFAFFMTGEDPTDLYGVLGDDVTIASERAAQYYRAFVVEHLGCKISEAKSYVPTAGICPGEFAKRLFSWGREITPLTPDLLDSIHQHNWVALPSVVDHAVSRWNFKMGPSYTDLPRMTKGIYPRINAFRFSLFPANRQYMPRKYLLRMMQILDGKQPPILRVPSITGDLFDDTVWKNCVLSNLYAASERVFSNNPYLPGFTDSDLDSVVDCTTESEVVTFTLSKGIHHPIGRLTIRFYWKCHRYQADLSPFDDQAVSDLTASAYVLDALLNRGYSPWVVNPTLRLRIRAKNVMRYCALYPLPTWSLRDKQPARKAQEPRRRIRTSWVKHCPLWPPVRLGTKHCGLSRRLPWL